MRTFIKIFNGKDGAQVEAKVNELAQEQGVIYTTVTFAEKPKARANAKKEVE